MWNENDEVKNAFPTAHVEEQNNKAGF